MSGRRRSGPEVYLHGALGLLSAVLAGSADLRGARCTEFTAEFDPDRRAEDLGFTDETERWQHVTAVCRACPARAACWEWSTTRSSHDRSIASGPTAATVLSPFGRRPRGRLSADEVQERIDAPDAEAPTPTGRFWNADRAKPRQASEAAVSGPHTARPHPRTRDHPRAGVVDLSAARDPQGGEDHEPFDPSKAPPVSFRKIATGPRSVFCHGGDLRRHHELRTP